MYMYIYTLHILYYMKLSISHILVNNIIIIFYILYDIISIAALELEALVEYWICCGNHMPYVGCDQNEEPSRGFRIFMFPRVIAQIVVFSLHQI